MPGRIIMRITMPLLQAATQLASAVIERFTRS
jgi:hypothetical protein